MHIFVKALSDQTLQLDVESTDLIASVNAKLQYNGIIPPGQHRLIFAGNQLDDNRTLADYNIQNDSTVYLAYHLKDRD